MAEIVNINTDKLIQAASAVADYLAVAAIPPAGALPPGAAPSPADLAAAGVAEAVQARIASAAHELTDKDRTLNATAAGASGGLRAHDADCAGCIAGVGGRERLVRDPRLRP
jgi:hypothetical protein